MKFLKNNLKVIIAFILGLILAGGIVYAATSAKEVTYTTAKNGNIKNVEDALNELYAKKSENAGVHGTVQLSTTESTKIVLGFKPSYVVAKYYLGSNIAFSTYSIESPNESKREVQGNAIEIIMMPNTQNNKFNSIDEDGFTMGKIGGYNQTTLEYWAF